MAARLRLLALALGLALVGAGGCNGPLLVLPGGALEGAVAPPPSDWSDLRDVGTVQLETRPEDPYSVNVWAVGMGPHLYVHAGANRATWVEHLEADPPARVRVEGAIHPLRATRVADQAEFDRFAGAYEAKYDTRPRNEDVTEAYLFRLEPR